MESFRGRKSLSLGGLGQPMANATRRTVVLIVVSIFGSLVFPGHGTAVLAQPCTGGNTIVQTVTSCPPPSEYSTYTVITPTPVVTSPPVTQPPPTTVPPLPPPILIPGLNWHVFSGALLGWSSSLRGVRASIYPWILGNWTQGYTRRLQRAFFMNSSATCFGSTLRCAYQRQVLQTSLSGSSYVTTRETSDFTALSRNYTLDVFKSQAEVNSSTGVNGSTVSLQDTSANDIFIHTYNEQHTAKMEWQVDIFLPVYRTLDFMNPLLFMTEYYTNISWRSTSTGFASSSSSSSSSSSLGGSQSSSYFGRKACTCFAMLQLLFMPDMLSDMLHQLRAQLILSQTDIEQQNPNIEAQKGVCSKDDDMWFSLMVTAAVLHVPVIVAMALSVYCFGHHSSKQSLWVCCLSRYIHHRSCMSWICRSVSRCLWRCGCQCRCIEHNQTLELKEKGMVCEGRCMGGAWWQRCLAKCLCFAWCKGAGSYCYCCAACRQVDLNAYETREVPTKPYTAVSSKHGRVVSADTRYSIASYNRADSSSALISSAPSKSKIRFGGRRIGAKPQPEAGATSNLHGSAAAQLNTGSSRAASRSAQSVFASTGQASSDFDRPPSRSGGWVLGLDNAKTKLAPQLSKTTLLEYDGDVETDLDASTTSFSLGSSLEHSSQHLKPPTQPSPAEIGRPEPRRHSMAQLTASARASPIVSDEPAAPEPRRHSMLPGAAEPMSPPPEPIGVPERRRHSLLPGSAQSSADPSGLPAPRRHSLLPGSATSQPPDVRPPTRTNVSNVTIVYDLEEESDDDDY